MENLNISKLVDSIINRECALFAGAGLTSNSGGVDWNYLVNFLKEELKYSSPLTDNFQIMDDLFDLNGPEKVYGLVVNKLKNAKLQEPFSKLTELQQFPFYHTLIFFGCFNLDFTLHKAYIMQNIHITQIFNLIF